MLWISLAPASRLARRGAADASERKSVKAEKVHLAGVPPYVTSNIHHAWCTEYERLQVDGFVEQLASKQAPSCYVLDVGMNDGFYTMLSAAMGCEVHAFEIQRMCIDIATQMLSRNGFEKLIKINERPVSSRSAEVQIRMPDHDVCDGAFSFSGRSANASRVGHLQSELKVSKSFQSTSLDEYVPAGTHVDVLKVDTEGHEPHVLRGARRLFAERRVARAYVELAAPSEPNHWTPGGELRHALESGYSAQFVGPTLPVSTCANYANETFTGARASWERLLAIAADRGRGCVDLMLKRL